jgi:glycosyltransferase involved in cell wall biosynthesis
VLFDDDVATAGISRLQMRDVLMGADAFVLPTRGEGWGLPVMEAMAMAMPVIVTNTSGCSQYLTQGNSFPLTPTPTPDGFSEPHVPQLQVLPLSFLRCGTASLYLFS